MKPSKCVSVLLLSVLCILMIPFSGCAAEDETAELIVFGASSMTETLTELGEQYMLLHPGISVIFNFDSSGALKTQIEEGADCDIFISAGQKQMDQLDNTADPRRLGFILEGSRLDILENKVVLAVPERNPAQIHSFDDLAGELDSGAVMLAIGNEDVPVGQYTQQIFEYYGLVKAELSSAGVLTYSSNVKEVTTQVQEAAVDCGIIYQTDAYSAGLTVVDTATAKMCGQVIYPAAILKTSKQAEMAKDFLNFLISDAADAVFAGVGFTPVG